MFVPNSIGVLAGIHLKALAQRVEARETDSETSGGIYMSLFQRLGSAAPEQKVFELFPQPQPLVVRPRAAGNDHASATARREARSCAANT